MREKLKTGRGFKILSEEEFQELIANINRETSQLPIVGARRSLMSESEKALCENILGAEELEVR